MMRFPFCTALLLFLSFTLFPATGFADEPGVSYKEITDQIEEIGAKTVWARLVELSDDYGHRINGSETLEKALAWSLEKMKSDGLTHDRKEKVMVPNWVRGEESGAIVSPTYHKLYLLGLGGTVGTDGKPLRGEVVVFQSLAALKMATPKSVDGKIVLINQPMPPYNPTTGETHYGSTVPIRTQGAAIAAEKGAIATLIRSVTARSLRTPHTGVTRYKKDGRKIPAAAVTLEDADRIARMAQKGAVTVEITLNATWYPDAESGNAIAEVRGSMFPDEVVVIGGHMDSWDVGDSSMDDGCGCVMSMEAAKIIQQMPIKPKRTIRVVLFTDEEHRQSGGKAYYKAHKEETHVAAIEADMGCGAPRAFSIDGKREDLEYIRGYAELFKRFGVHIFREGGSGADIAPLVEGNNVLGIGIAPDASDYFDRHHSPADTIDKLVPAHIENNALSMTLLAYILANRE